MGCTVFDSLAVHILALMVVKAHGHDGEDCAVLAEEEEIAAPPPAVGELDAEYADWKILFHWLPPFWSYRTLKRTRSWLRLTLIR